MGHREESPPRKSSAKELISLSVVSSAWLMDVMASLKGKEL